MNFRPSWPTLMLAAVISLAGCATPVERPVPVVAPCPELPPLPVQFRTAESPAAMKRLDALLKQYEQLNQTSLPPAPVTGKP